MEDMNQKHKNLLPKAEVTALFSQTLRWPIQFKRTSEEIPRSRTINSPNEGITVYVHSTWDYLERMELIRFCFQWKKSRLFPYVCILMNRFPIYSFVFCSNAFRPPCFIGLSQMEETIVKVCAQVDEAMALSAAEVTRKHLLHEAFRWGSVKCVSRIIVFVCS